MATSASALEMGAMPKDDKQTLVVANPMVDQIVAAATPAAAPAAKSSPSLTRARIIIAVLAITNVAAIVVAAVFFTQYHHATAPPSTGSQQLFAVAHPTVEASDRWVSKSRSSDHMQRSYLSHKSTAREGLTVAAGVTRLIDPKTKVETYDVFTEIYNDGTMGEFTSASGSTGDRSLRLRIRQLATGAEVILVPQSLSFASNMSLIPNHYFFSHKAGPNGKTTSGYASTLVKGRVVMFNDIGQDEWTSFMPGFFAAYEASWVEDHGMPTSVTNGRRLGFGDWAAGKIGGYIGGAFGDEGRDIGSDAAQGLYDGDSVGSAVGGAVGGDIGGDIGGAVGADVGGVAGGALGTAIGGPVGGVIGEEVGSWAGREIGSHFGHEAGEDIGSSLGDRVEGDVKNWVDGGDSNSGGGGYGGGGYGGGGYGGDDY